MAVAPANVVPPQNLDAEESVLGAMMVSEGAIVPVVETRLGPDDFYRQQHRLIFRAIQGLWDRSESIDQLTVCAELAARGELDEVGGKGYVSTLASTVPAAANAQQYAEIVRENALLRRLLTTAQQIEQNVMQRTATPRELVDQAERDLFQVSRLGVSEEFVKIEDLLHREIERIELLQGSDGGLTGIASGFSDLDHLTGGFQPGNLIVLAARPSMGKSALAVNIAEHAAVEDEKRVAIFSLEMSDTELAHRLLSSRAPIRSELLRTGPIKEREWKKVWRAGAELAGAPLWIDESSDISMGELRAKARRMASREGLDLLIVDYLQLMRPDDLTAGRVEQVGQMSRGLKLLSRELRIPVIAVAQLNRAPEQRPDKRPLLSDLRESGQLEQDADLVLFIYRDEYYLKDESDEPGIAEINIAKHRNGKLGRVKLAFIEDYTKFRTTRTRDGEEPVEQPSGEGPPL